MPLSLLTGFVCLASGIALLRMGAALRSHLTPEKRERRRRLDLHLNGRLGDALLTEFHEDTLYYTYDVRGVHYTASQDITGMRDQLPVDTERLGGMVTIKYSGQNPANSILICEEWSGLRLPPPKSSATDTASADANAIGHSAHDPALTQSAER
jgi:hypothetical protein